METQFSGQQKSSDSSLSEDQNNFILKHQITEWVEQEAECVEKVELDLPEIFPQKDTSFCPKLDTSKNVMLMKRKLRNHPATQESESDSDDEEKEKERSQSSQKIEKQEIEEQEQNILIQEEPVQFIRKQTSKLRKRPTQIYEEIYCQGEVSDQFNIFQIEQLFSKLSKRKIQNYFQKQITTRNSSLNYLLNQTQRSKMISVVDVIYFGQEDFKKLVVNPKEMTAAEFICRAIKQYQRDPSLNQDLLEFPNFPLVSQQYTFNYL